MPRLELQCGTCGNTFSRLSYFVARSRDSFCSLRCKWERVGEPWTPTPETAAYVAGIMDGEGAIMISVMRKQPLYLSVRIGNTNRALIDYLATNFNGSRSVYTRPPMKANHKPCHMFVVQRYHAASFLIPLLPYLIVKRQQAELGVAFQRLPYDERHMEARGRPFWSRCLELNA